MEFQRICEVCGMPFLAKGNRAKYCKSCARERMYKQQSQYKARKKAEKPPPDLNEPEPEVCFCDNPENIATCLACTRSVCLLDMDKICPELKES